MARNISRGAAVLLLVLAAHSAEAQVGGSKISQMPTASLPLAGTDALIINQCAGGVCVSGNTHQITLGNFLANLPAASIPNAALANSSITIAGHSVALGGTQAIACGDLSNGATGCSTATGTSGATIPLLNGANTWSAAQTFAASGIKLSGSSTGATTFASANAGASNYTLTFPAVTDTVSVLGAETFTGTKTFADSGTWGESGVHMAGTYTNATGPFFQLNPTFNTTNQSYFAVSPIWQFSATGQVIGVNYNAIAQPMGASVSDIQGLRFITTAYNSAVPVASMEGMIGGVVLHSTFTGTSAAGIAVKALVPGLNAGQYFGEYDAFATANGNTNGQNAASGTVYNRGFSGGTITAAAPAGVTINNQQILANVPSGSGAGTTNNKGIYITGNGGSGGGGTTTNYALYSDSTAPSYIAGAVSIAGAITANGSAGVSCPAGITAGTVTVVNGIVTHC